MIFKRIIMNFVEYILATQRNGIIHVKIIPNSRKTEIIEIMENWVIKIKISALPEKWKANIELLKYLSNYLRLKKDCIHIIWWVSSQFKKIKIDI